MRNFWLAVLPTLLGCSSDALPPPEARLLVGQESETWSADPAPTHVQIELVTDKGRTMIGQGSAPTSVVTIRDPGVASGTLGTFEATAVDAAGTPLVRGVSVPYLFYGLSNVTIPIFVARPNAWSRPPENFEHGRNHPVTAIAWHQYVISAGGEVPEVSPALPDVYDAVNWRAWPEKPVFPLSPKTMVFVGTWLLFIDDADAVWLDFSRPEGDRTTPVSAPTGLTFAEIAGGEVFELLDGSSYVVGATRLTGDPTSKVLRIDKNRILRAVTLAAPRHGAAAGVVGDKLVVWGGSAKGPGAEVLTKAGDAFAPLPFAPDATSGLGLAALDATTALLAGGTDPVTSAPVALRSFDVTCAADCAATEVAMASLALQRTHVYPLAPGNVLFTGDSSDGEFHAFSFVTANGTTEIVERPLRERRKAATSLLLPNGQPGVLGGQDPDTASPVLSIESFFF